MTRLSSIFVIVMATTVVSVLAQTEEVTPEEANQLEALSEQAPASQAPGEDVMRPTKHGIRLTPRLARAFAGFWISEELEKEFGVSLSDEQKEALSGTIAQKMMRMGHAHGSKVAPFLEFAFENVGPTHNKMTSEKAKEFAEKAKGTIPIWRELFGSMTDDCRPYLDEDQLKDLERKQRKIERGINRFDQRMDRWSRGEVEENEAIFDDLDDDLEDESADGQTEGGPKKSPEVTSAERRAVWATRDLEPANWAQFLNQVRQVFKLTDEQYAKGRDLLKDYTARVRVIATPEWREKARRNRALHSMGGILHKESPAPWLFHLDREYNEMVKPVLDMQKAFRLDVLGLVTPEQRQAVIAELHEFAGKHGMTAEEADVRFPTTQPSE